jgi:excisionase family DNA binding protein
MAANASGSTRKPAASATRTASASISGPVQNIRILGNDALLRPEHCAQLLGCGKTLVYHLMSSGYLPFVTLGSERRVTVGDLKSYIRSQERKHGKP